MSEESTRRRRRAAAALRYDRADDAAPRVLATGHGEAAEEMVELARAHDVPVHADPQLAELLATLDVGAAIPEELYRIVAEVLIFVYEVDQGFERTESSREGGWRDASRLPQPKGGEASRPPPVDETPRSATAAPPARGATAARDATPSPTLPQEK